MYNFFTDGGMAEWFKAHAWKACWGSRPSGVRIPLPPPYHAFDIVDEKLRDIVELDKRGLSQTKIAEQLNLSQGEVSKRIKRAKEERLV